MLPLIKAVKGVVGVVVCRTIYLDDVVAACFESLGGSCVQGVAERKISTGPTRHSNPMSFLSLFGASRGIIECAKGRVH